MNLPPEIIEAVAANGLIPSDPFFFAVRREGDSFWQPQDDDGEDIRCDTIGVSADGYVYLGNGTTRPTQWGRSPKGTARLNPGFYCGFWELGFHKQDPDRPALVEWGIDKAEVTRIKRNGALTQDKGYFGINLHNETESEACLMTPWPLLKTLIALTERAVDNGAAPRRFGGRTFFDLLLVELS